MSKEDLNIQSSLMSASASRSAKLPRGQCSTARAKIPESRKRPRYRFRFSCRISLSWRWKNHRQSDTLRRLVFFVFLSNVPDSDFVQTIKSITLVLILIVKIRKQQALSVIQLSDRSILLRAIMYLGCCQALLYLAEESLGVLINNCCGLVNRNLLQPNPVTLAAEGSITGEYQSGLAATGRWADRQRDRCSPPGSRCWSSQVSSGCNFVL